MTAHTWLTKHESKPDLYDDDDIEATEPDELAYAVGYHNGPKCSRCGFHFCVHCNPELRDSACTDDAEPVPGDDANLYSESEAAFMRALGYVAIASR